MRTRVLAAAAAVAIVAGGVTVGALRSRSGGEDVTSSYRITYSSEEPGARIQQTVIVEVDRPYRARSRVYAGDQLVGGSIWTESGVYVLDDDGTAALVQPVLPGRAGPDVRLEVLLPAAVTAGKVDELGPTEVAGIACTEYRSNGPLDAELPESATEDDRTVSCVDDLGRVLREEWRIDGVIVRRREAMEVVTGVDLTDDELFSGPPPQAAGLTLLEVRAVSLPGDPVLAVAFPDRLFGLRRDLVVEARDVQPPGPAIPTRVSQRAIYTDGSRVVTLTQSRALTGPEPALPDGDPFELAPFDRAVIAPSFDGFTVTGMVGNVRVEIRGPFTSDEFAAVTVELAS
jgi:hypothetical protein